MLHAYIINATVSGVGLTLPRSALKNQKFCIFAWLKRHPLACLSILHNQGNSLPLTQAKALYVQSAVNSHPPVCYAE